MSDKNTKTVTYKISHCYYDKNGRLKIMDDNGFKHFVKFKPNPDIDEIYTDITIKGLFKNGKYIGLVIFNNNNEAVQVIKNK